MSVFVRGAPDMLDRLQLLEAIEERSEWLLVLAYYEDVPGVVDLARSLNIMGGEARLRRNGAVCAMFMYGLDADVSHLDHPDMFLLRYHLVSEDVMQFWREIMNVNVERVRNHECWGLLGSLDGGGDSDSDDEEVDALMIPGYNSTLRVG